MTTSRGVDGDHILADGVDGDRRRESGRHETMVAP